MLPKITPPTFRCTLPISGIEIVYHPYLVGSKKAILMAMEGEKPDPNALKDAMINISLKCIVSPSDIDPSKLTAPDMQWLMLNLRAKSEGEVVKLNIRNFDCPKEKSCVVTAEVDLEQMTLARDPSWTSKIMLTDEIGVRMRVPTLGEAQHYVDLTTEQSAKVTKERVDKMYDLIILCMEQIFTNEDSWIVKNVDVGEVRAFLDQLTDDQMRKLNEFFSKMPQMTQDLKIKCPRCEKIVEHNIRGASDFFV